MSSSIVFAEGKKLNGISYTEIAPADFATQIKAGKIGIHEYYYMEGLVFGSSTNDDGTGSIMIQKAGMTNIFELDKPMDLEMGQKVRIYFETTTVNTVLMTMSESKIIKIELL
jgi:hypothetical protein